MIKRVGEGPGNEMNRADDGSIKVSRQVPIQYVIGLILTGLVNAGVFYERFSTLIDKNTDLTIELKKLSAQMADKSVSDAKRDARIEEHERRLNELGSSIKILESSRK